MIFILTVARTEIFVVTRKGNGKPRSGLYGTRKSTHVDICTDLMEINEMG